MCHVQQRPCSGSYLVWGGTQLEPLLPLRLAR